MNTIDTFCSRFLVTPCVLVFCVLAAACQSESEQAERTRRDSTDPGAPKRVETGAPADTIVPEASKRPLDSAELEGRTVSRLRLTRDEVFAYHGFEIWDRQRDASFESQPWYARRSGLEFTMASLRPVERRNVDLIEHIIRRRGADRIVATVSDNPAYEDAPRGWKVYDQVGTVLSDDVELIGHRVADDNDVQQFLMKWGEQYFSGDIANLYTEDGPPYLWADLDDDDDQDLLAAYSVGWGGTGYDEHLTLFINEEGRLRFWTMTNGGGREASVINSFTGVRDGAITARTDVWGPGSAGCCPNEVGKAVYRIRSGRLSTASRR